VGHNRKTLVVVPNHRFGLQAASAGLIGPDEHWEPLESLERVRGVTFTGWRYLDTLDRPPGPGSSIDVVEAWLAREETPFPPLDSQTTFQLDAMVLFAGP
jgi:hypothetical protein